MKFKKGRQSNNVEVLTPKGISTDEKLRSDTSLAVGFKRSPLDRAMAGMNNPGRKPGSIKSGAESRGLTDPAPFPFFKHTTKGK